MNVAEDQQARRRASVAILGAGIEGRDLARFLVGEGARITVFDTRSAETVAGPVAELTSLGVRVELGPINAERAADFAAIYISQSVLLHREPFVLAARALGLPIASMLSVFLQRWPGPVAGVTGSSGKTTTTALVAAAFSGARVPHILGGNIGAGLLAQLVQGSPATWAVLEISHTQLQLLPRSPHVAAVTNVTPNHLDQFDWDAYVDLKRRLVQGQAGSDRVVLNAAEPVSAGFVRDTVARPTWFNADVPGTDSFFRDGNALIARRGKVRHRFLERADIALRGDHNLENVLCAAAVANAAEIPLPAFARAAGQFRPVPHRLEQVDVVNGVTYINDSIATSPERTLAGMRSFLEPLVLLLGGREKRLPLEELIRETHRRAHAVVLFGEAAGVFEDAFVAGARGTDSVPTVVRVNTLDQAVATAAACARPGDVVLLSPACTSFDAYPNFERRGEEFRQLVAALDAAREDTPSLP